MDKIEELLAERGIDPSQYEKDVTTGQYHLKNNVILEFPTYVTTDSVNRELTIRKVVDDLINEAVQRGTMVPITYTLDYKKNGNVVVTGADISFVILQGSDQEDPTPTLPKPKPPGTRLYYDSLRLVVAYQNNFRTIETVLPLSQLLP